LIFIIPIWILKSQVTAIFASMSSDVGQQIAIFHTLFNVVTTLVLLPFSNLIVKLVCSLVVDKKAPEDERFKFAYIDERLLSTPPVAVGNTKNEIIRMSTFARENINLAMQMLFEDGVDNTGDIRVNEQIINHFNKAITAYLTKLMSKDLSDEDDKKVGSYYHVVSDIERVGDYAENIMEYAHRLRKEELVFSDDAKNELKKAVGLVNDLYEKAISAFDQRDVSQLDGVAVVEQALDDFSAELENRHIQRVRDSLCSAPVGSIYLQTVSNLERVGDHITNVAFSIRHYRHSDSKNKEIKAI
jgi:phosphate:Na+ symporter